VIVFTLYKDFFIINFKIIKLDNSTSDSWIIHQRCPTNTWKNRDVWKPVTMPLKKDQLQAWLDQNNTGESDEVLFS
jgi:hypothetical protein